MADRKLTGAIRSASALNLRYSADLLNLARNYVRDFSSALTAATAEEEPQRPPATGTLLLAGKAGETANAAFAIRNSAKLTGAVTLQVDGDFPDAKVRVDPERLSFDDDGEKIVRILATIGKKTPVGQDMAGTVTIPELDHRVTAFVLRRLPD